MTFHIHFTFPPSMTYHISLPHVIWRIELNPLHITDVGRMIFPFCPQHDTLNFMLQDLCSTGA